MGFLGYKTFSNILVAESPLNVLSNQSLELLLKGFCIYGWDKLCRLCVYSHTLSHPGGLLLPQEANPFDAKHDLVEEPFKFRFW